MVCVALRNFRICHDISLSTELYFNNCQKTFENKNNQSFLAIRNQNKCFMTMNAQRATRQGSTMWCLEGVFSKKIMIIDRATIILFAGHYFKILLQNSYFRIKKRRSSTAWRNHLHRIRAPTILTEAKYDSKQKQVACSFSRCKYEGRHKQLTVMRTSRDSEFLRSEARRPSSHREIKKIPQIGAR